MSADLTDFSPTADVLRRLDRLLARVNSLGEHNEALRDAAAEIRRLKAENERLRAGTSPRNVGWFAH